MKAQDVIKASIDTAEMLGNSYLADLSDAELFHRPAPSANHINWQIGHLIVSENGMLSKACPGAVPPLPAGMAEKYTKETSASDQRSAFCTKDELLAIHAKQRAAAKEVLAKLSETDLDKPTGLDYAPNVGAVLNMGCAGHWMMHYGQWSVVRRQLGRPPLF